MDEKLQKQLIRQLKLLNFWITTFGVLLLIALGIIGFFLFQVFTAVQSTADKIQNFQQQTSENLNVKNQLCTAQGAVGAYLQGNEICKDVD